jgi:hypothetical protein
MEKKFLLCLSFASTRHPGCESALSEPPEERETESNNKEEERAEAGERAQRLELRRGTQASPRAPSLPLLGRPPLPPPRDSIQDG